MAAEHRKTCARRSATGPSGTAMAETILVLPLIVAVLSLIIFFGWAMRRLQQASVIDRYEAWREVVHAPGPAPTSNGMSQLNQTFFADHAQRIAMASQIAYPSGARQPLINDAYHINPTVGRLADRAINDWPEAREVVSEVTENSHVPFWQQFAGPLRHHHVRLDNEWKYVNRLQLSPADDKWQPVPRPNLTLAPNVRQLFFPTLDEQLRTLAQQGNPIARSMRDAYALEPPYQGPSLPAAWHLGH